MFGDSFDLGLSLSLRIVWIVCGHDCKVLSQVLSQVPVPLYYFINFF
jgi:hypothetical protein